LRVFEELAARNEHERLLAEQVRLSWLAQELVSRKLDDRAKTHRPAGSHRELLDWLRHVRKRGRVAKKLLIVMRKLQADP
jgi:hypothetical protein